MNAKDLAAKAVTGFHRAVFQTTRGRVAGRMFRMPVVMLTTTGRRSGKRRHTMLTSPVQEGDRVILVASWGGDDRHPTWFLNLREHPDVEIVMEGERRPMRARVADAAERERLWSAIVEHYKGYSQYQTRTDREIPVVILEPGENA